MRPCGPFPICAREGLCGVGVYYDGVVDDVKLALEVIYDGLLEERSEAINYLELADMERDEGGGYRAFLRDSLNGREKEVRASSVVFATGPFTDQLLKNINIFSWQPKLLPSQGSHLWVEREYLPLEHPVLLTPRDGRVVFAIPKGDKVLVGTTDTVPQGSFFDLQAGEDEIDYLLARLGEFFPHASIDRSAIAGTFAGIRPLVKGDSGIDRHRTDRQHKIFRPDANAYVVLGGKYTTFRIMGQEVSRNICLKNDITYNSNLSTQSLRRQSVVVSTSSFSLTADHIRTIVKTEKVRTLEDLIKRRLGVPSHSFWREKVSLEDFFAPLMPELRESLEPSSLDLSRFSSGANWPFKKFSA